MRNAGSEFIKDTGRVPSLTFSAIMAKFSGQMARDGYTRNRRVRPARPYPVKLVDRATRTKSPG
jgi:hypothetical protein